MMGIFEGKMLLTDLDGTLFDSNTVIPERNLRGIRFFTENGGRFGVATGRSPLSLKAFVHEIGVNLPCVVLNGCGIYDYSEERAIYSLCLEKSAVELTSILSDEYKQDINTVVFFEDGSMAASKGTSTLPPCFDAAVVPGKTSDPKNQTDKKWAKTVFVGELSVLNQIEIKVKDAKLQNTVMTYAGDDMLELLPGGTTKGGGMLKLAELLDYSTENVFAIGDHFNDYEMLLNAGISCAAGQAPEEIKKTADYTACSCDEGCVGYFIELLTERFSK